MKDRLVPIACPCCNQSVPAPSLDIVIDRYGLAPMEARIFSAIWRGKGMPVMAERIFDAMYADDPDGGPDPSRMYRGFQGGALPSEKEAHDVGYLNPELGYRRGYRIAFGTKWMPHSQRREEKREAA